MIRRALAEFLGTAFLLIAVVGSGIAAAKLSPGQTGLELLENAAVTGVALGAIILMFGPVSGAHLNPIVSLVDLLFAGLRRAEVAAYIAAQLSGAVVGVILANLMYSLPTVTIATTHRRGGGLILGEVIATFGLVMVVFSLARSRRTSVAPFAVGAYIAGAYFFTSSTSFANPAVTPRADALGHLHRHRAGIGRTVPDRPSARGRTGCGGHPLPISGCRAQRRRRCRGACRRGHRGRCSPLR